MKVGIITIHKIPNFGSHLQAYALQYYLQKLIDGKVEIIDYTFPNKYHTDKTTLHKEVRKIARITKEYIIYKKAKRDKLTAQFRDSFYQLSEKSYPSVESIEKNPPIYDLYITGSDQVWNTNTLKNDPVMYCHFAPQRARRISFGASFSIKTLPNEFKESVRSRLNNYSHIGVREKTALNILTDLKLETSIKTTCTCDPTLLLSATEYKEITKKSTLKIEADYILVYMLDYAFMPEPALSICVEKVQKELGCKVFLINHSKRFQYKGKYEEITGIGPCEFASLFEHAKYVITSSFHGTMFSIINRKPFTAILPKKEVQDSRIGDILSVIGLNSNGIHADADQVNPNMENPFTVQVENKLTEYIEHSKAFLKDALQAK